MGVITYRMLTMKRLIQMLQLSPLMLFSFSLSRTNRLLLWNCMWRQRNGLYVLSRRVTYRLLSVYLQKTFSSVKKMTVWGLSLFKKHYEQSDIHQSNYVLITVVCCGPFSNWIQLSFLGSYHQTQHNIDTFTLD